MTSWTHSPLLLKPASLVLHCLRCLRRLNLCLLYVALTVVLPLYRQYCLGEKDLRYSKNTAKTAVRTTARTIAETV